MKTIVAIIEKAEDGGYGVYTKSVQGAYGYGLTEQEAKNDFVDVLNEQAEFYKEKKRCVSGMVYGKYIDRLQI